MRRSLNRFLCSTKACDLSTGCYCFDTCQCFWNSEEKESFWQLSRGRTRLEPGKVDGVMGYLSSKRWGLGSILLTTWSPWTLQSSSIICEELFLGLEYWERMEQAGQPEGCCNNFPEESQTWLAIPMWRNACICPSHWCRLPIKTSKVSIRSSLWPTLAHDTLDHWSFSHSCGLHSCPTQEDWLQSILHNLSASTSLPLPPGKSPWSFREPGWLPPCVPVTPWFSRSPQLLWCY